MACTCEWGSKQCFTLIKILNIICGLFLIALGIIRLIFNDQLTNFLQFLLSIYYILFGALVIATEFNWEFIKTQFSFQKEYRGRGIFLIFIGILCFDSVDFEKLVGNLNFACGIVVCCFGIVSVLSSINSNSQPEIKYESPVDNQQKDAGISRV